MAAGADRRARNEVEGRAKRSCEQPDPRQRRGARPYTPLYLMSEATQGNYIKIAQSKNRHSMIALF